MRHPANQGYYKCIPAALRLILGTRGIEAPERSLGFPFRLLETRVCLGWGVGEGVCLLACLLAEQVSGMKI